MPRHESWCSDIRLGCLDIHPGALASIWDAPTQIPALWQDAKSQLAYVARMPSELGVLSP